VSWKVAAVWRRLPLVQLVKTVLMAGVCIAPMAANGQGVTPPSQGGTALKSQQGTSDVAPAPAATVQAPDTEHLLNLTGPLSGIGKSLADIGIYASGYLVNTDYSNASGGNERANVFFGRLIYGLDFDLNKIVGIPGASIRVQINTKYGGFNGGENYASGSLIGYLSTQGPNNITNLADFTYHQSLFDGHVHFLVGRTSLGDYFATSPQYCQFVVGLCQNLTATTDPYNSQAPYQPIATWAGAVAILPTPHTYLRVGASADNPSTYYNSDFPWDKGWSLKNATGVFVPVEAGYATTPYEARYAGRYSIGFQHDSAENYDPGTGAAVGHSDALYLQAQQIVWRPNAKSERAVHLLAGATLNTTHNTAISSSVFAGVFVQGPFPNRPDDVFGAQVSDFQIGKRYTASLNSEIAQNHDSGTVATTEQIIEVNYGISVAPGIQLKPFAYYTVHPDQLVYGERPTSKINDAIGVGAQLFVSLNYAFGLPVFTPAE
jgi:porin